MVECASVAKARVALAPGAQRRDNLSFTAAGEQRIRDGDRAHRVIGDGRSVGEKLELCEGALPSFPRASADVPCYCTQHNVTLCNLTVSIRGYWMRLHTTKGAFEAQ